MVSKRFDQKIQSFQTPALYLIQQYHYKNFARTVLDYKILRIMLHQRRHNTNKSVEYKVDSTKWTCAEIVDNFKLISKTSKTLIWKLHFRNFCPSNAIDIYHLDI